MASELDTAQRRAEAIASKANECCYRMDGYEEAIEAMVLDALQQARRAALLETAQVIRERAEFIAHDYDREPIGELEWFERERIVQAAEDFITQLDRLAQEGAPSIDLSTPMKDDGGYGEHF